MRGGAGRLCTTGGGGGGVQGHFGRRLPLCRKTVDCNVRPTTHNGSVASACTHAGARAYTHKHKHTRTRTHARMYARTNAHCQNTNTYARPGVIKGRGEICQGTNFEGDNFGRGEMLPPPGILRLAVMSRWARMIPDISWSASNDPRNHHHNPECANYWAPLPRHRHHKPPPPQPSERSDPAQHAEGMTGDCPGRGKETATRRHVTQGRGGGSDFLSAYFVFLTCGRMGPRVVFQPLTSPSLSLVWLKCGGMAPPPPPRVTEHVTIRGSGWVLLFPGGLRIHAPAMLLPHRARAEVCVLKPPASFPRKHSAEALRC